MAIALIVMVGLYLCLSAEMEIPGMRANVHGCMMDVGRDDAVALLLER